MKGHVAQIYATSEIPINNNLHYPLHYILRTSVTSSWIMLQYSRKEQSTDCKRESLPLTVARFPSENFYSEHKLKSKGLIYSLVFFWKEHIKSSPSKQLFQTVLLPNLGKPLGKYLYMHQCVCYILYIHIYSQREIGGRNQGTTKTPDTAWNEQNSKGNTNHCFRRQFLLTFPGRLHDYKQVGVWTLFGWSCKRKYLILKLKISICKLKLCFVINFAWNTLKFCEWTIISLDILKTSFLLQIPNFKVKLK